MAKKVLSIQELEQIALKDLSNYDGEDPNSIVQSYTGADDIHLDFTGTMAKSKSFADMHGEMYTLNIVNANASTRYLRLCKNYKYLTGNGLIATGAFNDTNGDAGLSATGTPKPIEEFLEFVFHNPCVLIAIKFKSTQASQIDQGITYQELIPFRTKASDEIAMAGYSNEDVFQDKQLTLPVNLTLGNQADFIIPIVGSSTLNMTLVIGGTYNTHQALNKKKAIADQNINRLGGAGAVRKMITQSANTGMAIRNPKSGA